MKISEYIEELQRLLETWGDLEVLAIDPYRALGAYRGVQKPRLAHKAILLKRERTPRFHGYSGDSESNKGEKVIRI